MRFAICIAVKNRSYVVVDKEDSYSFLQHVSDKIVDSPELQIEPTYTNTGQIVLELLPKMLRSLVAQKKPEDDWVCIYLDN